MPAFIKRLSSALRDAAERHRERHRSTGCSFALAERVELLNAEAWDQITGQASVLLQRPYLMALAATAPANVRHRFAIISKGDQLLAAIVCQIITVSGQDLHGPAKSRKARLQQVGINRVRIRTLICGNMWTWGNYGVAIAPDADPEQVWPALGELLYRIRRSEALDSEPGVVMVKDLPTALPVTGLRRLSYRPIETEPDMVLELHPSILCFDDYLKRLQAKYRKIIRDVTRDVEAYGLVTEPITHLAQESAQIYHLYRQVQSRAEVRPVTLSEDYLPRIAAALGPAHFHATGVRNAAGVLVAFITCIRDGDTVIAYYVGFDQDVLAEAPIYFHIMHQAIAIAIAMGGKRVSFGRTALEVKARLGAKPVPLCVWTRHRRQPLNVLMRPLLGLVKHSDAPERHPFKQEP
jgi:hypothetical protein